MIYTVTLNPSVDLIIEVEDFQPEKLNRTRREQKFPGGKGINVSRILHRIGVETTALGFIGGFTGAFIRDALIREGINIDFVDVEEDSRINIKLKSPTGEETEINGMGPVITDPHLERFLSKLDAIDREDMIVFAGSIPRSLPGNLYEELTKRWSEREIRVVVDATGNALLNVIKHKPFLIKPNHHELGELFGVTLKSVNEIIPYGRKLVEMGAQHVIVSMAENGALFITDEGTYLSNVPKGQVVNSVGAGDSLVAGFLGTYARTGDLLEAFRFGVATGSATAFSQDLCTKEQIEQLYPRIEIQKL
ncbi:1-phosphofructokinase [Paenactinomyces guangxiensis]|uniref:Tagatose-6-phosphate kinase n=1 Tax=Paenactinomyces guangxiensis TaxID=1490290 RepID=A0A7W1WQC5_9BACL|nr:1-phosphofructokinase [Paenactinomyces guangxiensis]MBA4494138.1 1-phosphofructokinase [Paenactinomyces guangxiensis]MBH8591117.1 1-phosphofructokinase [Paenactinomyces guangxiensis]